MSGDDPRVAIKKLAGKAGGVQEMIQRFEALWRQNRAEFESVVAESWSESEFVPQALKVVMCKWDDADLREIVCNVADRSRMNAFEKASLFLVSALWGDEARRQRVVEGVNQQLQRAVRSRSPKLSDLTWSFRRGAMIGYWADRGGLQSLMERFKKREMYDDECLAMVRALLEVQEKGLTALADQLERSLAPRRVSSLDVAACFILGAAREKEYGPLFLTVQRDVRGWGFWHKALRRCALASFAYVTLPGEALQRSIEEWLLRERKKLSSWWFGDNRTSEFMTCCDILWNVEEALTADAVNVLQAVATGGHKENAKEAVALLSLKGVEAPRNAAFDPDSMQVKWRKDFIQYDQLLNFAYYWRCRPKVGR